MSEEKNTEQDGIDSILDEYLQSPKEEEGDDVKKKEEDKKKEEETDKKKEEQDADSEPDEKKADADADVGAEKKKEEKEDKLSVADLMKKIEELEGKLDTEKGEPVRNGEEEDKKEEVQSFISSEEELNSIISSPENFNKFLTKFASAEREKLLQELPEVTTNLVSQRMSLKEAASSFKEANKDLTPVLHYVGSEANKIQNEHPDWTYSRIFDEAGKKVRGLMNIEKKAEKEEKKADADEEKEEKTAFAKTPSGKRDTEPLKGLQAEIDDVL